MYKRIINLMQALRDIYGLDKLWILLSVLLYVQFLRPISSSISWETGKMVRRGGSLYALTSILKRTIVLRIDECFFRIRPWTGDVYIARLDHEKDVAQLLVVREGDTVVDIGAHIGAYTIRLAKRVGLSGHIISLEPDRRNLGLLVENIRLNDIRNVHVVNKAAYNRRCTMTLFLHHIYTGGSSLNGRNYPDFYTAETVVAELGVKHVDWLKIDVEGAELEVLTGAVNTLQRTERIIVEVWPTMLKGVCRILDEAGFIIAKKIYYLGKRRGPHYYLFAEREADKISEYGV